MYSVNINQIEHFQHRLEETISWCSSQNWSFQSQSDVFDQPHSNFPGQGLRTKQLCPSRYSGRKKIPGETNSERRQIVEQLAIKRAQLLQKQDIFPRQTFQNPVTGRLLAFNPDGNTSDGAHYQATQGFIDDHNVPAWDTWIVYVTNDIVSNLDWWDGCNSYLLSWVPDALIKSVETGISVNSDDCIRWATDLDTIFIRQLKQAGIIL